MKESRYPEKQQSEKLPLKKSISRLKKFVLKKFGLWRGRARERHMSILVNIKAQRLEWTQKD